MVFFSYVLLRWRDAGLFQFSICNTPTIENLSEASTVYFNDIHMHNNFRTKNEPLFGPSVACILEFKTPWITLSFLMLNFMEIC